MGAPTILITACLALLCVINYKADANPVLLSSSGAGSLYRGKYIGRFTNRQHKVSGEVYATDARTIHIRGFTYDGTGPDAFFWTGFTDHPSPQGIIIPDEKGTKEVLGAYNNQDITISLPDGLTLRDIKWLGVWCRAYEVNFGDLYIPADLDFPQPHVIGSLQGQHGVTSGPIVVVDAQTILVPDFSYDGQAPDVHFWVGRGKPGPDGIRVPDETGGDAPLVKSDKKTMVLSLPGDLTIFDIDFFGVWCRLYYVDFGHVRVPKSLNVPPSLKMLGVTPQLLAVLTEPRQILTPSGPVNIEYTQSPQVLQGNPLVQLSPAPSPQLLANPVQYGAVGPAYVTVDGSGIHHAGQGEGYAHQEEPQIVTLEAAQQHGVALHHPVQVPQLSYGAVNENLVYSHQEPAAQTTGLLTAASTSPYSHQAPGTNGYSTFTINTSRGPSTSVSLY